MNLPYEKTNLLNAPKLEIFQDHKAIEEDDRHSGTGALLIQFLKQICNTWIKAILLVVLEQK